MQSVLIDEMVIVKRTVSNENITIIDFLIWENYVLHCNGQKTVT